MNQAVKYLSMLLAGVLTAEATLQSDSGASKKQKVLDVVNAEVQTEGQISPAVQAIGGNAINVMVGILNIAGYFQHKSTSPAK